MSFNPDGNRTGHLLQRVLDAVFHQGLNRQLGNPQLQQTVIPVVFHLHAAAEAGFLQSQITFDMLQLLPCLHHIPAADAIPQGQC
ncbi:hypothetical protein D3C75_888620 [compost metagenome]